MIRLSSTIFLILAMATSLFAQNTGRSVVLVTIGPGDEVYEQYGHNMILLRGDPGYKQDVLYHWGLFSMEDSGFVWRFIQGRMSYMMAAEPYEPVMEDYRKQGRQVICQQLSLTEPQIDQLIMFCEINRRPENRKYLYNYYTDNCSTRVRDMLDKVLEGQISRTIQSQTPAIPMSYRQHSMRLSQESFLLSLGMDFVLGPMTDRPLSAWEETFLPLRMSQYLAPLAIKTWSPWESSRLPESQTPPDRRWILLSTGCMLAAVVFLGSMSRVRFLSYLSITITIGWWIVSGLGGLLLLYLWFFTDHEAAYRNQNLLAYSPWNWAMILLLLRGYRKRNIRAMHLASYLAFTSAIFSVAALALHGWALKQDNLHFILLATPINLVVLWVVLKSQQQLTELLQKGEVDKT